MDLKNLQSNYDLAKWLSQETTVAVLAYLRANCPFLGNRRPADANVVVNNEGAIQGFFAAIDSIETCGVPVKDRPKETWQPYQKPSPPPEPAKPSK